MLYATLAAEFSLRVRFPMDVLYIGASNIVYYVFPELEEVSKLKEFSLIHSLHDVAQLCHFSTQNVELRAEHSKMVFQTLISKLRDCLRHLGDLYIGQCKGCFFCSLWTSLITCIFLLRKLWSYTTSTQACENVLSIMFETTDAEQNNALVCFLHILCYIQLIL